MNINDIIKGFKVTGKTESAELGGTLWQLEHVKTGGSLVWIENGEENKLFSIAFKTIPSDDTGVFHILEHSVLNGSKKFTTKEPFVHLLKSSLNTFLNAMTFSDKTLYPVASRNEKDFMNLAEVYLDAVFAPAIYNNPYIFMQEGWHYELPEKDGVPYPNGVVFNEMKGALSSPDTLLMNKMMSILYPDTSEKYESGGDPAAILDLTYEKFIETHKEFYHPSNSFVYLDGDVPLEKVLELVDSYFARYEKRENLKQLQMQERIPFASGMGVYEGDEEDGAMMMITKLIGDYKDRKRLSAFLILCDYLAATNESPLKKAILDKQLAQDVNMFATEDLIQPMLAIQLRQINPENKSAIYDTINECVKTLVNTGLDKEAIGALIDQMEFAAKDVDEPAALMRNIMGLITWLHGGNPLDCMACEETLNSLREELKGDYFEEILKEINFDCDNAGEYILVPSKTKGEEDLQAEIARMEKVSRSWNDDFREQLMAENEKFAAWQCSEDSEEDIATIPCLSLDELPEEPEFMSTKETKLGDTTVLVHDCKHNGIAHYNVYFSLAECTIEQIQKISHLTNLLGGVPTKRHTVSELEVLQRKNAGFIDYNVVVYRERGNRDLCKPYLVVTFSALNKKESEAAYFVTELLKETDYESEMFEALLEIVSYQCKESMFESILGGGNRFASMRALAKQNASDYVNDQANGVGLYTYLCDFIDNLDDRIPGFAEEIKAILGKVLDASNMVISVTGSENLDGVKALVDAFSGYGDKASRKSMKVELPENKEKEFIVIPSPVSYAAHCGNITCGNGQYEGSMETMGGILRFDYLWNEIRVRGGAYGTSGSVRNDGTAIFSTYRDPSPMNSLEVFKSTPEFLRSFAKDNASLDNFVIGAMSTKFPLLHKRAEAANADRNYFGGISLEDEKRWYKEMLESSVEDIEKFASWYEGALDNFATCVIGTTAGIDDEVLKEYNIWEL